MSVTIALLGPVGDALREFGDAIEFIFKARPSEGGGIQVGGLGEIWDFTRVHLLVSIVAMAVACAIAVPSPSRRGLERQRRCGLLPY